jgi:hypothetical protein
MGECVSKIPKAFRKGLYDDMLDMLWDLAEQIEREVLASTNNLEMRERVSKTVLSLQTYLPEASVNDNKVDLNFTCIRMLTMIPFPAALPQRKPNNIDMPLSLRVGEVFDAAVLPNRHIRPIANLWFKWAHKWVGKLASLRSKMLLALGDEAQWEELLQSIPVVE